MSWPTIDRDPVRLRVLPGHDDRLWEALIELTEVRPGEWTLFDGQMVLLHAFEHGVEASRVSTDSMCWYTRALCREQSPNLFDRSRVEGSR